jgi:tRNASer (uridine44-2'-O)-methyltransferase
VCRILAHLLSTNDGNQIYKKSDDQTDWNGGHSMKLNEVVKLFDGQCLEKLKSECGGLKTLIKNHFQLFSFVNKNEIRIKIWNVNSINNIDENEIKKCLKTKQCLFELYHPNGCLLNDQNCLFIHQNLSTFNLLNIN